MQDMQYILAGCLVFSMSMIWSRIRSNTFISPASIFISLLFIHLFLDPFIRFELGRNVKLEHWEQIKTYNFKVFVSCVASFFIFSIFINKKFDNALSLNQLKINVFYIKVLSLISILISFTSFVAIYYSGAVGNFGIFSGYGGAPWVYTFGKFIIRYNIGLVVFLFVLTQFPLLNGKKLGIGWALFPILFLMASDIITLGRTNTFTFVLMAFAILAFRNNLFTLKNIVGLSAVVFILTIVASTRNVDQQVLSLPLGEQLARGTWRVFSMAFTTLEGQENLWIMVSRFAPDQDNLFYGSTYFWNLLKAMRLGWLVPSDIQTPTFWFAANYLSANSVGGRDFGMLAEAYMNFGVYGWVVFIVIGLVLSFLNKLVFGTKSVFVLMWAALVVTALSNGLRNDSLPIFTKSIFYLLPVLMYYFALCNMKVPDFIARSSKSA